MQDLEIIALITVKIIMTDQQVLTLVAMLVVTNHVLMIIQVVQVCVDHSKTVHVRRFFEQLCK